MVKNNIKIRLLLLNKKAKDVIKELNNRGEIIDAPYYSRIISGECEHQRKSERVIELTEKIISEWEERSKNERSYKNQAGTA